MIFWVLVAAFIFGVIACKCWGEAEEHGTVGLYITSIALWGMVLLASLAVNKYAHLALN